MLWLMGKQADKPGSEKRKRLVLAVCECARLALPYVLQGEILPLKAIETAEAWAQGTEGVTLEMVRDAADAAYAYAAYAYAAVYAAAYAAAAFAAYAAYAAYAATYATYAATYTTYAAICRETLKQCADIVRRHYPTTARRDS